MDLQIKGKVAIITGGSEGIGRATAERLSAEGALVAIAARTQEDLDRVAKEINAVSGNSLSPPMLLRYWRTRRALIEGGGAADIKAGPRGRSLEASWRSREETSPAATGIIQATRLCSPSSSFCRLDSDCTGIAPVVRAKW